MAEIKWIKITTDIFDDEKILLIESMPEADSIIVIWFKLLCMAGKQNNNGIFMLNDRIAYTDEMLATIFRRPLNVIRLALKTFEQFGMVEIVNDVITIPNWEKHQNAAGLDKIREQNRKRVSAYRNKQKQTLLESNVTSNVTGHYSNAIEEDKDIDKDIDKEKESDNKADKPQRARFVPPTVEQVKEYCRERKNSVDAERFVDYYTANGWTVGRNKMKDWKAAVRTWEKNGFSNAKRGANGVALGEENHDLDGIF